MFHSGNVCVELQSFPYNPIPTYKAVIVSTELNVQKRNREVNKQENIKFKTYRFPTTASIYRMDV